MKNSSQWNWIAIAYLLGLPLLALALLPMALHQHVFTKVVIAYFVIHFSLDCLSITVGYHRLFSHHSFKASPWLRRMMLVTGAGSFQNSALIWAADHRIHHRCVDTNDDPYSIRKGFLWAHFLWMFHKDPPESARQYPADLKKDAAIQWQHRNYLLLALLMGWGVPLLVGALCGQVFGFFYVGAVLRLLASGHCTFCINSVAHVVGTRPFSRANSARDNWFVSLFTFGEGYHNFHHKFQADYRNGIQWYAWDPSKWSIYLLSKVGFCWDLIRVPNEEIQWARQMVLAETQGPPNKAKQA